MKRAAGDASRVLVLAPRRDRAGEARQASRARRAQAGAVARARTHRRPGAAPGRQRGLRRGGRGRRATSAKPAAEAKSGGKTIKTKTYTFGAMDVEGKLKTPQLLYFLNRVKLELDMSAPDKRSFMKELDQSADDKSL